MPCAVFEMGFLSRIHQRICSYQD
nr:hypothetical protein [Pseudomonas sp. AA-38]